MSGLRPLANLGRMPGQPWESRVVIGLDFRDWWIGAYVSESHVYVCPLPCLVIRVARPGSPGRPE